MPKGRIIINTEFKKIMISKKLAVHKENMRIIF